MLSTLKKQDLKVVGTLNFPNSQNPVYKIEKCPTKQSDIVRVYFFSLHLIDQYHKKMWECLDPEWGADLKTVGGW